jgi:extensin-like protein
MTDPPSPALATGFFVSRRGGSSAKQAWLWALCLFGVCVLGACAREQTARPGSGGGAAGLLALDHGAGTALGAPTSRPLDAIYPMDSLPRSLSLGQLDCPSVELVEFSGVAIQFVPAARVIEPFRQRLLQFEAIVSSVAQRFYGRAPHAIGVVGSYGCRSVSGKNRRLSEHALGNAIDIQSFQFAPSTDWPAVPAPLPAAFEVRIERHWKAKGDPALERHARFLEQLTHELIEARVFRTLLGPSHPEHADHFHFDMAPENYVDL